LRAIDPALTLARRWGAWREALDLALEAARGGGDAASEA